MAQWWKNPDGLSSAELLTKAADCWERGNAHEDEDSPILAQAAYSKATIAIAALNRKGLAFIPFTSADACWCQPFEGPAHPKCPMHGGLVTTGRTESLPSAESFNRVAVTIRRGRKLVAR